MDVFDASVVDDLGHEDATDPYHVTKEQMVFLIDAQPDMLEPCNLPNEEYKGLSWIEVCCRAVAALQRQHVIQSETDEASVIFYSTQETTSESGVLGGVFVQQALDGFDVLRIKEMETFTRSQFEQDVGSAAESAMEPGLGLKNALWAAAIAFDSRPGNTAKTVIVFTRDEEPAKPNSQARTAIARNMEELASKGAAIRLYPLAPDLSKFSLKRFWQEHLDKAWSVLEKRGELPLELTDEDQIGHLAELRDWLRCKAHKKRPLGTFAWKLGEGLEINVALYATLLPATRGTVQQVDARTNELLDVSTALVDAETGLVLQSKEQPAAAPVRLFYPNPSDPRTRHPAFPKTYVTEEELMQARRSGSRAPGLTPGLRLVGFKPAGSLAPHHALRAASFLYPRDAPGAARKTSSPLFVALHGALLSTNSLAVCEWVRSSKSEPRLVAVLPQREHRTAQGQQVQPPGMSMVYLPYADDIRHPEKDPWLTNPESFKFASPSQVALAVRLIESLQLGAFRSDDIPNPHLQRHYAVLEAIALGEEPPEVIDDETLPDDEAFDASRDIIAQFRDATGCSAKASPRPGSKRPQPFSANADELKVEVDALRVPELAAAGKLQNLTVAALQKCMQVYGLPKSGTKAQLVERVQQRLRQA